MTADALQTLVSLREAVDGARFGGKAARQAQMANLGVAVPDGFVIAAEVFAAFLAESRSGERLADIIDATLSIACDGDPTELQTRSDAITAAIMSASLPVNLCESLAQLCRDDRVWIVRSSAVGEDGEQNSFAGQLTSIADVRTASQMERALLECWASTYSTSSLAYQHHRGTSLAGTAVLIQRQIVAKCAGVLFTMSPICDGSVSESDMLCEFVRGHGAALVDGEVDPVRVAFSRVAGELRELTRPDGECVDLSLDQVAVLWGIGQQLEDVFGSPQDIEWAIDATGKVHFVQSRPVTSTITPALNVDPDAPRTVWSNANVCENFPDAISPFLYSVARDGYYHYFRNLALALGLAKHRVRAMDSALHHLIGVHGGRMYYNLSNLHTVIRLAPAGEFLGGSFDDFVGAKSSDANGRQPVSRSGPIRRWLEIANVARSTTWHYLFLTRRVEKFERRIRAFADAYDPQTLARSSKQDLRRALQGFLDIRFHHWLPGSLADTGAMVCYGALKRFLHKCLQAGERDDAPSHNAVLTGLQDIVSAEPIRELWRLSRIVRSVPALMAAFAETQRDELLARIEVEPTATEFRTAFASYLQNWGFRSSGELMLTVPTLDEDPAAALELIRPYLKLEGDSPDQALERQAELRRQATREIHRRLAGRSLFRAPLRRLAWSTLVRWTKKSIRLRERARLHQALLYNRARHIVLAIGARLVEAQQLRDARDAFWFRYDELEEFLASGAMFPDELAATAERRRHAHQTLAAQTPPDHFEMVTGSYLDGAYQSESVAGEADGCLTGTGAAAGRVHGRASVLRDLSEMATMQSGDILVAPQTDPGWAPLFFLASGLVLERGGMLSHGAILAREYGIPTVVGCAGALQTIRSGDLITVDGDRGRVHVDNQ
ncbi:MAG: phosphohistidine swiveling domain-containing protein [Hyphomicrobiaceae bacterium]